MPPPKTAPRRVKKNTSAAEQQPPTRATKMMIIRKTNLAKLVRQHKYLRQSDALRHVFRPSVVMGFLYVRVAKNQFWLGFGACIESILGLCQVVQKPSNIKIRVALRPGFHPKLEIVCGEKLAKRFILATRIPTAVSFCALFSSTRWILCFQEWESALDLADRLQKELRRRGVRYFPLWVFRRALSKP